MPTRRKILAQAVSVSAAAAALPALGKTMTLADEPAFDSATALAENVRNSKFSALELTEYFIARIERLDPTLNAVVVRDFERALAAAKEVDAKQAAGQTLGALQGVPMTVKESYNVAGLKTTWGNPMWKDMVAKEDAAVVQSYKQAGAIILGKTNVPLMLGDYQSFNEIYGTTNNPWDVARGPGGSSGGSAAALAAGLCGLESGSDIGGSIRNPAHYCGVYGHKPTWNIVPMTGHQPPVVELSNGPDLAVVGPLARSADDLETAMDLITGPNQFQAKGWRVDLPAPRTRKLKDLRVAIWPTEAGAPVSDEIAERALMIGELLSKAGAKVSDTARPDVDMQAGAFAYLNLMEAVNTAGVPPHIYAEYKKRAAAFAPEDNSMPAVFARAAVQSHNDWVNYDGQRLRIRAAWNRFFTDWDILLCPISSTTAFPHDQGPMEARTVNVNGEQRPYFEASFWAGMVSLPGLPSTVFPTGLSNDGLPIGLQAISAEFDDYTCIEFAKMMAREIGGFVAPPGMV